MKKQILIPADDIDTIIEMLSVHAYGKEQYEECLKDLSKIDDAFAFDHAAIILLLGRELEE